jgi:ArsR family transcriptional regulator
MSDALQQFKSDIFQGLANPTRIALVELLREGELSAGQLIARLGLSRPTPRNIWLSSGPNKSW